MFKTRQTFFINIFILLIVSFGHSQSKYNSGLSLKSIQADFLSLILINSVTIYSDIDVIKLEPVAKSFGVRMGFEAIHMFGLVHPIDDYPIRNLYISLRVSSNNIFHINTFISYVNSHTFLNHIGEGDGYFIRVGAEASKYFFNNKIGLKFKLNYPIYTVSGKSHGFIGLGIVTGLLSY